MADQGKKLFKYWRGLDKQAEDSKRLFFYRVNRWRFDPYDYPRPWRSGSRGASSIFKFRYMFVGYFVYRLTIHYIYPSDH